MKKKRKGERERKKEGEREKEGDSHNQILGITINHRQKQTINNNKIPNTSKSITINKHLIALMSHTSTRLSILFTHMTRQNNCRANYDGALKGGRLVSVSVGRSLAHQCARAAAAAAIAAAASAA